MEPWTEKRILILGTTYPTYSKTYVEHACTGGIVDGTYEMVRLHPLPIRYLEERFHNFQWITAKVVPHPVDTRPESMRVEPNSIVTGDVIPSTKPETRRYYVERAKQAARSVEELADRWSVDRTSLGVIRPKEITGIHIRRKSESARAEWMQKEQEILRQQVSFGFTETPKPLDFPEVDFRVSWLCDDPRCVKPHNMNLLTWGIHEQWRRFANDPDRESKVRASIEQRLDMSRQDVFFFLGNMLGIERQFALMDVFSPTKTNQLALAI